jgi:hypothetical protein
MDGHTPDENCAALSAALHLPIAVSLLAHNPRRHTTTVRLVFLPSLLQQVMADVIHGVPAAQFGPVQRIEPSQALH